VQPIDEFRFAPFIQQEINEHMAAAVKSIIKHGRRDCPASAVRFGGVGAKRQVPPSCGVRRAWSRHSGTKRSGGCRLVGCRGLSLGFVWLTVIFLSAAPRLDAGDSSWRQVDTGLSLAEFAITTGAGNGNDKISVLRIDPDYYAFRLLCSSELGRIKLTAKEWCQKFHLTAAVNAGMYQEDGLTSVGYMKNFDHINNPRLGRDKTILAFNPVDSSLPPIQLIDRDCQDFNTLRLKYRTLVQSIRMISCAQENVWTQQPQKWSTVAIGLDQEGRVLFLFCQAPRSVHDFVDILLSLPISIRNAMYLEGGPQATLYLSGNGVELTKSGGESAFSGNESLLFAWPIPNVIGILKKTPPAP
jgi:uncharacterized protein YigE (DUF2233 family)